MESKSGGGKPSVTKSVGGDTGGGKGNKQAKRNFNRKAIVRQPKFEGKCEELKGHIYDCSDARQADVYVKTTKEIAEYVGHTYKYGSDARLAVENLELPTIPEPNDPATGASATKRRIWEKKVDEYVKRIRYLEENIKTIYSLVWGQCTEALRARVEAQDDYEDMAAGARGLDLLMDVFHA